MRLGLAFIACPRLHFPAVYGLYLRTRMSQLLVNRARNRTFKRIGLGSCCLWFWWLRIRFLKKLVCSIEGFKEKAPTSRLRAVEDSIGIIGFMS